MYEKCNYSQITWKSAFLCNAGWMQRRHIFRHVSALCICYHMKIIVHGHPKDQRDECEHIKGTLNLPFLDLILSLRSLTHKMSKYEVGAHSPCQSQSALTNTPVGHSIHRMVFAFFSSTSSPCINQHCITINFFFLLLI
jgi:hypothetical protein